MDSEILYISHPGHPKSFILSIFIQQLINAATRFTNNTDLSSTGTTYNKIMIGSLPVLITDASAKSGKELLDFALEGYKEEMDRAEFYAMYSLVESDLLPALNYWRSLFNQEDLEKFTREYSWPLNVILYHRQRKSLSNLNSLDDDALMKQAGNVLLVFEKRLTDKYFGGAKPNLLDKFIYSVLYAIQTGGYELNAMLAESKSLETFMKNFQEYFIQFS